MAADPPIVTYGDPVTLTAHLAATDVTNDVIEIENNLGAGPIDDYGNFVFDHIETDEPRAYEAYWGGDELHWPIRSESVSVKLRIRLEHALLETKKFVGDVAIYTDDQNPKYGVAALPLSDGTVNATVQKRGRFSWKTIEQRPHVLNGGKAVFGFRGLELGRYRVRSHAEKAFGFLGNTSPWLHFKVQAKN